MNKVIAAVCEVPGCDRPKGASRREWCDGHYNRWRTTGSVQADKPFRRYATGSSIERLLENVRVVGGCWEWTRTCNPDGYGMVSVGDGTRCLVTRVAYELFFGPIPPGMNVCHRCDNPACFWPFHLFLGTQVDNMIDAREKGRLNPARGERSGRARLTDATVRELRQLRSAGWGLTDLGRRYGVTAATVRSAANRETWRHVA